MRPVMYLFANRGLGMTPGKLSAQVAHAAVEAFQVSDPKRVAEWYEGHHYTKLVMLAEDSENLLMIERYLEDRGFKTRLIIDEGRTEIKPHSPTALGVEIVDKDNPHVLASFESFRTYKELPKPIVQPSLKEVLDVIPSEYLNRQGRKRAMDLCGPFRMGPIRQF